MHGKGKTSKNRVVRVPRCAGLTFFGSSRTEEYGNILSSRSAILTDLCGKESCLVLDLGNLTLRGRSGSLKDGEVAGVDAAAVDEQGLARYRVGNRLAVHVLVPNVRDLSTQGMGDFQRSNRTKRRQMNGSQRHNCAASFVSDGFHGRSGRGHYYDNPQQVVLSERASFALADG